MRRVTILIKYKGYIEKTLRQVEKVKNMEEKQIPAVVFGKALYEGRITLKQLADFL